MSQTLPLIALGGALGSVLRYLMVVAVGAPWGVAAVNVLGSFAIGVLFVLIPREGWQLFLMSGLLGGFTTFSAFSLDTLKLIEQGQPGQAAPSVPKFLHRALARASVSLLPPVVRRALKLGKEWDLSPADILALKLAGRLAEKVAPPDAPHTQACVRLGLPADFLYRKPAAQQRLLREAGLLEQDAA